MKYINADKLIAEIEKRAKFHNDAIKACTGLNNVAITHSAGWKEDTEIITIIDSLQQEPQEKICSKCIHYGKDDGYCYNPHGGMQSSINENGIYKCTGFCEKEQEQPDVDLEKEIQRYLCEECSSDDEPTIADIATHFYELGRNTRKEE